MNQLSTAGFVPPSVYIGFRLVVLLGGRSGHVSAMLWKVRGRLCLLGEQFCWHPVLRDPAPSPRRAPRPDPPVVCPGFGLDNYVFVNPLQPITWQHQLNLIIKSIKS